jgi:hypothetical protein
MTKYKKRKQKMLRMPEDLNLQHHHCENLESLKHFIPYNKGSNEMKLQPCNDLASVVFSIYR